MTYYKTKRDATHKPICSYLRDHGVEVLEIFEPLDILVHFRGFIGLIEIKVDTRKGLFTRKQLGFIAETHFPVAFAKSGEEALAFLKDRRGLTQAQKDGISRMLLRNNKMIFTQKDIDTATQEL